MHASIPVASDRFKSGASKEEGSIASVFASLAGESHSLPETFAALKRSLVQNEQHAHQLQQTWKEVLVELKEQIALTAEQREKRIPYVEYSSTSSNWLNEGSIADIKRTGVAVIRDVVDREQVLDWKQQIRDYASKNPAKGFPAENPQVYELYWTVPQLQARGHPALLDVSKRFLQLFHQKADAAIPVEAIASLQNPLTYADRLRIRQPGDAKFALGPHIDGGGVERWECPSFRSVFRDILERSNWKNHDAFDLGPQGQRLRAQTSMYDGAGQCSVFRPWQGWMSMSDTKSNEGTLRVLPFLRESSAYIMLRPFFRPITGTCSTTEDAFLEESNWEMDLSSPDFPGCSLGHNIELSTLTHPHLQLDMTMTSIPSVAPGDMVLWHCDLVHSVERQHAGAGDSSVMYIPAIPLTLNNAQYVVDAQRNHLRDGTPPWDFPGGQGESAFDGRGHEEHIQGASARRAMGLETFSVDESMSASERALIEACNAVVSK